MYKLAIIVPFRDREDHLRRFVPHINYFLRGKDIDYEIFVIEQSNDGAPFNKSRLMNAGFLETKEDFDYFCFHDVDCLPCTNECDYSYVDGVSKLAYSVSALGFQERPFPPNELGGVVLINKESFIKVNGWGNAYWGWGAEDDDFGARCRYVKIKNFIRRGKYLSLPHQTMGNTLLNGARPDSSNKNLKHLSEAISNNTILSDGVAEVKYKIISSDSCLGYKKITIEI